MELTTIEPKNATGSKRTPDARSTLRVEDLTPRRIGFHKWFEALDRCAYLGEGWASSSAPAPGQAALNSARSYLNTLDALGWAPSRVAPSVMGGIGVTHQHATKKVYVEFYNEGGVHALLSDRAAGMDTFPVDPAVAAYFRFIGKAREYLNG
jgi:hypothetical protein